MDMFRRRRMTRLVLDNDLTPDDVDFLALSVRFHNDGTPLVASNDPVVLNYAEKALCDLGKKIVAIKSMRSRSHIGLKDAKDIVDAYCESDEFRQAWSNHGV